MKKTELLLQTETWMNLTDMMLSEKVIHETVRGV